MPVKSKAALNGHETPQARPFLKWAGGKRQLLGQLVKRLPPSFHAYHEPFLGGGALFFELAGETPRRFEKAYLSDLNEELIETYQVVQTRVEDLIVSLKKHDHNREYYNHLRSSNPKDIIERASRLIYLNRTCYNGLYRVNSKGGFNVPFGNYRNPKICDEENLRACSRALKGVVLGSHPFDSLLRHARKGDFVYFDPPYHPVSKTANFAAYGKAGFDEKDHHKLKDVFVTLDKKKCSVMLSNSYAPFTRKLFQEYEPEIVQATRLVNSKASARGPVKEIIVRNY
jgi:DNA adenine methylase